MTVEERLEALEKEVQQLKDVQAIKELKSKYFRALDTKNWDELETTMTPNISTICVSCWRIPMALPANGEEMERLPFPAARAILRGCLKMMMMRRRFILKFEESCCMS